MSAKAKWVVAAFVATFVVGAWSGIQSVGPAEPEFVKVPGPTKIVHETGPTVYIKTPLNEHCKLASQLAATASAEAGAIYDTGDEMLAINAQFRQIMASSENTTKVEEDLRDLQAKQIGHLGALSDAQTEYAVEAKLCKEAQ